MKYKTPETPLTKTEPPILEFSPFPETSVDDFVPKKPLRKKRKLQPKHDVSVPEID